ncbi:MAG: thiosulfate oxidation carrier complex protein SoxZ, partial [Alphaproteobacteria bacterium]|nr:thiosulfate oxidation carrier complex protein SoxZ [Alphaproteobacteria bacterium]
QLESDIAISEDPSLEFSFRSSEPAASGMIKAEVLDSNQRRFTQSWPVPAAEQM